MTPLWAIVFWLAIMVVAVQTLIIIIGIPIPPATCNRSTV
jgi:hypothetical protein